MPGEEKGSPAGAEERFAAAKVADFASSGILACTPQAPLTEVAWLMANNDVHAVVVAGDGIAESPVISDADLVSAAASGHFGELRAIDVAVTEPVRVSPQDSLARAAELLARHHVAHLIVCDERSAPVGVLSTADIARAIAGAGGAEVS